jgi:UTP--glucose-1-phosphate uridylyltransferase
MTPEPPLVVRKALVPMAGLGTRLFPASHAVKKELFPIVGPDGIARALLHYHLRDLAAAGLTDVCLVVQPGEAPHVRAYLQGPDGQYRRRLATHPALVRELDEMRALADHVHFVVQHTQDGYGHAVLQAKDWAAGEPVLLCLGDHLFRGRTTSPHRVLADMAAVSGGRSVSAVNRIGEGELGRYGVIAGTRRAGDPNLIDVSLIIEKPDVTTARERLRVNDLPNDVWLGWLGMHLLGPSIFDVLDEMVRDDIRDRGEIQLTRAQDLQRQREGYLALEMLDAERFDFGTPDDFLRSSVRFSAITARTATPA